ncbi:hypothetical protein Mgra_00007505, partial [Meloidogyne graminicola]
MNSPNLLSLEFSLFIHFRDDRLQLRDLNELPISLTDEFIPWQPKIQLFPLLTTKTINYQKNTYLSPNNGLITFIYRFSGQIFCESQTWKEPFEKYFCHFWIETEPDERLQLTVIRDLRPINQINYIKNNFEEWPWLLLKFNFYSKKWQKALICFYLPSLMLFISALLAQWKRRKIQIFVLICVIICLILLQNIYFTSSFSTKINLMDLWLISIFVHLICLLSIDLTFPSRRIIIFKQKIIKKSDNENKNNELIMENPNRNKQKEINNNNYYSPSLFSTLARKIVPLTITNQFRPTFLPSSSNSLNHHYVSSPKLSSFNNHSSKRHIISVLPNKYIYSSPSSPYCSSPKQDFTSYNQIAVSTSSVPPFKDYSIQPELTEKINNPNNEKRHKAIIQLLDEMEYIRNIDDNNLIINYNDKEKNNKIINTNNINSSNQPNTSHNLLKQPLLSSTIPLNIPQSFPLQKQFYSSKNSIKEYKIGKTEQFSGDEEEEEEEIGRIEGNGLGMPKQKRLPFLVIFTIFKL